MAAILALAAMGAVGPIAALVQNVGTVLVVPNSGRLLRFDGRQAGEPRIPSSVTFNLAR